MTPITKQCRLTGQNFLVTDEDQAMLSKMGLPLPTLSPLERQRKRMFFRNDRSLYHRKCDLTGRQIIALYDVNSPHKVYDIEAYWTDQWDPKSYGRDFDFSRPFFEQFAELQKEVPRISLNGIGNENSPYTCYAAWNRNCHLIYTADRNEDCYYGYFGFENRDCMDWLYLNRSELCYEVVEGKNCYHCLYSTRIENCTDCFFCEDCVSCTDCFGSIGLRNKQYCFFNEQLSKEDYQARLAALRLDTHSGREAARQQVREFFQRIPKKALDIKGSENCSGDHIKFSRNVYHGFDVEQCEDVRYVSHLVNSKDCMDYDYCGDGSEMCYEISSCVDLKFSAFCNNCWGGNSELFYCEYMSNSSNCFGSIGMKKGQYCILNKQYSKEEYEALKARIIEHMKSTGEWGEFFPPELCPHGYNESVAQDYHPLTAETATALGFAWKAEKEKADYQGPPIEIPDAIADVSPEICKQILTCEVSGEHYKIIPQELAFYKRHGIPVPRRAHNQRHADRLSSRNPWLHWQRKCSKCGTETTSSYSPERPDPIYCEACYNAEIY